MPDKAWKRCERELAKRLGGQRVGPTGRSGPDVLTPHLAVEVKERQALPRWLTDALRQASAGAGEGRVAVLVLHQKGQRYSDAIVCMRLKDFQLLGELGNASDAPSDGCTLTRGVHP